MPQFDNKKAPSDLRIRDALQKQRIKHYADRSKAKGYKKYKVGQKVLILKMGKSKMSANWENQIYQVVSQKGTALKLLSNYGDLVYRNVTHVRPYYEPRQRQMDLRGTNRSSHELGKRMTVLPRRFRDYQM